MTQHEDRRNLSLDDAVRALRDEQPGEKEIQAACQRVSDRLRAVAEEAPAVEQIRGCSDIERLMPAYRAGTLTAARALLVEAHLRECVPCRRRAHNQLVESEVRWAAPLPQRQGGSPRRAFALAAAILVLALGGVLAQRLFFAVPAGARATLQTKQGAVYRMSDSGAQLLEAGGQLGEGETARTAAGAHAFVRLMDGSVVEIAERTTFAVQAKGRDLTFKLDEGAVIVQAAKRHAGHLYVRTPDCRVAVTGTVFSVKSGLKGSRVFVIRGEVRVAHEGQESVLHPGDQVSTSASILPVSAREELAWSQDLDKYIELLAQFSALRQQLEAIPLPANRYSSDLLARVPGSTVLYASIPNVGEALGEANEIFQRQLQQSPALQDWWTHGRGNGGKDLNQIVEDVRQASQYLGDEIVIAGMRTSTASGIVALADLRRSDLRSFLDARFAAPDSGAGGLHTMDENELLTATPAMAGGRMLVLVRPDVVAFSPDLESLRMVDAQLNNGPSGFPQSDFGQRVQKAFNRGAGFLLAINLEAITQAARHGSNVQSDAQLEQSGLADVRYLIAGHAEGNGQSDNRLTLDFAGTRHGIASWLAAPAPMGSLDFVSHHAGLVFSFVAKRPADMLQDLTEIVATGESTATGAGASELQARVQQLALSLGGDASFALDGPVLPTPAWKLVVQVYDPVQLQGALEQMVGDMNQEARSRGQAGWEMQSEELGGQRYYAVRSLDPRVSGGGTHYAYAAGYLVVAGSRAVVMKALQTRLNGDSLSRSAQFTALLPPDRNTNYSAVYQNLSPILQPLASQLSPESLPLLQQLAADSRPSAICAYGEQTRIEIESNGRLLGFDFLEFVSLLRQVGAMNRQVRKS